MSTSLSRTNIIDPRKERFQVVIATMPLAPRHCKVNSVSGVSQLCDQDYGNGNGGISVCGAVPYAPSMIRSIPA